MSDGQAPEEQPPDVDQELAAFDDVMKFLRKENHHALADALIASSERWQILQSLHASIALQLDMEFRTNQMLLATVRERFAKNVQ